jgi:hypothetical protein
MPDFGVHHADLSVHDAPISVFTIPRFERSRWAEIRSRFRPARGPVFQGVLMPKSEEYRRLETMGIPVPRWSRMTMNQVPDCAALGRYVIVKPDLGAQGADVRYARATRVRWKPPTTGTARVLGGPFGAKLVQEFIYTGPWPVSYRVVTLFGNSLWCLKIEASHGRMPLEHRLAFADIESGTSVPIVSSGRECTFESSCIPEVLALGESAHRAFPEIGLLGVDVLRDVDTDKLYVIEVNSLGYVWHVNSLKGRQLQAQFQIDIDAQWGVTPKAARILVDTVRTRAD